MQFEVDYVSRNLCQKSFSHIDKGLTESLFDYVFLFSRCRAYKSCGQGGPPHVKIVVEWDKETKD